MLRGIPRGAQRWIGLKFQPWQNLEPPIPFLLPHKFIASYYAARDMNQFRKALAGPVGAARQFWTSIRNTPFIEHHPNMPEHLWPSTIPLGFHADGGAFSKQDSLMTISWNSLFSVIRKNEMNEHTLDAMLRIFHGASTLF